MAWENHKSWSANATRLIKPGLFDTATECYGIHDV